jgi:hypothetical protein
MKILYFILYRIFVFFNYFGEEDDDYDYFQAKIILSLIIGSNVLAVLNLVLSAFDIKITNTLIIVVSITTIILCLLFKNRKIIACRIIFEKIKNKKLIDWLIGGLIIFSIGFYTVSLFLT